MFYWWSSNPNYMSFPGDQTSWLVGNAESSKILRMFTKGDWMVRLKNESGRALQGEILNICTLLLIFVHYCDCNCCQRLPLIVRAIFSDEILFLGWSSNEKFVCLRFGFWRFRIFYASPTDRKWRESTPCNYTPHTRSCDISTLLPITIGPFMMYFVTGRRAFLHRMAHGARCFVWTPLEKRVLW